jgi:hypothetical protein
MDRQQPNGQERAKGTDRRDRLAEALRANLHRRKQQARTRSAGDEEAPGDPEQPVAGTNRNKT